MPTCMRCGIEVNGISSLFTFNKQKGRCKNCDLATQQALLRFRETFLQISSRGSFSPENMKPLSTVVFNERIDMREALEFIQADALNLLNRTLSSIVSQGQFNDYAENYIRQIQLMLAVPDGKAYPLFRQMNILNIRRGKFPLVPQPHLQDIRLESDEACYLLTTAQYQKINASSSKLIQGRLVATNKKLRFLSATGGAEIAWNSVMGIKRQTVYVKSQAGKSVTQIPASGVYLELNKKTGNGFYAVADPETVEALIDTLVRIAKRQLVKGEGESSRHIAHEVKTAVWQRDQGKCVQCGASDYLEYDHIIPYSKGGASTLNNVQLLCRRCNLAKSDRI